MNVPAMKQAATIAMSRELLDDAATFAPVWAEAQYGVDQAFIDMLEGPRLGPGRREYRRIMEPVWRRERLQAELARMGRPAGPFRSAPGSAA
jgi:hypothetical protein